MKRAPESARRHLEVEVAAAKAAVSKRMAAEQRCDSLRLLIDEMLHETAQWRKQSSEAWTKRLHALLAEAQVATNTQKARKNKNERPCMEKLSAGSLGVPGFGLEGF